MNAVLWVLGWTWRIVLALFVTITVLDVLFGKRFRSWLNRRRQLRFWRDREKAFNERRCSWCLNTSELPIVIHYCRVHRGVTFCWTCSQAGVCDGR